jgi:1-acyl-sn-glycerol-3-phosphate acyltransferase
LLIASANFGYSNGILLFWAMLYRFAYVLMWVTFRIFFRRIDVVGLEKLPKGKPVILIANHPASFLDAMVLAVFLRRSLHFYVRGDIFSHPLAYRILTILHMIPIYSKEHGEGILEKNKRTFDRGRQLLSKGKMLLVFPEGFSRHSKELVPLKKGAARVALQTAFGEGQTTDLHIQAIAINYSWHGRGASLFIRVGEHMNILHLQERYISAPPQAINVLTAEMQELFHRNVIHIQEGKRTELAEELIRMHYRNPGFKAIDFFDDANLFCQHVTNLNEQLYHEHLGLMDKYQKILVRWRTNDRRIASSHPSIQNLVLLFLLLPFFLVGFLIWVIPGSLSKWITDKTVTRIDFYTSVYTGVLGVIGLLCCIGLSILGWKFYHWPGLLVAWSAPFYAYLALWWIDLFKREVAHLRYRELEAVDEYLANELSRMRKKLVFQ